MDWHHYVIDRYNKITYLHFQMLDTPPVEPHQTFFQDSPWKTIRGKTLSTQTAARYRGQQVCVPHQHMCSNKWAEFHHMSRIHIYFRGPVLLLQASGSQELP